MPTPRILRKVLHIRMFPRIFQASHPAGNGCVCTPQSRRLSKVPIQPHRHSQKRIYTCCVCRQAAGTHLLGIELSLDEGAVQKWRKDGLTSLVLPL